MAKRKRQRFQLTPAATKRLNAYLTEIRRGIENVCEIHTHDSAPSMTQAVFETSYIDQLLGQTADAITITLRAMTEGVAAQKQAELNAIIQGNYLPEKGTEDIT